MKIRFNSLLICAVLSMAIFNACSDGMDGGANEMAATDSMEAMTEESMLEDGKSDSDSATTWKKTGRAANALQLNVGDTDTLPLEAMQMTVKVDGFRARVLIDSWFFNDRDWQLEGTFKLRLPEGASPYYLAFGESVFFDADSGKTATLPFASYDANQPISLDPQSVAARQDTNRSQLREAVVTTKEKAALAYGNTVRRRIDPALMEWAGADVFNCRVFPLLPSQMHHVVVGYDVNLLEVGDDFLYTLDVPACNVPLRIDFDVADINGEDPEVAPATPVTTEAERHRFAYENPTADQITVRQDLNRVLLANDDYVAGQFTFEAPRGGTAQHGREEALFLVDVSLSSDPGKFNIWLDLMEQTLANNRDAIQRFNVLFFNVEGWWYQPDWVQNTPENLAELMAFSQDLTLEGATDIGLALDEAKAFRPEATDVFLLSDGGATWGESDLHLLTNKLASEHQLFAYRTGLSGTDLRILEELTRRSGGAIVSVLGAHEVDAASKAYRQPLWQLDGITMNGANDILLAGRPATLYDGQTLLFAARQDQDTDQNMTINVSRGSTLKEVTQRFSKRVESDLAFRLYGVAGTQQLEELGYLAEDYAESYGTHFRVAGKTCSFVMLESQADYDQFGISSQDHGYTVSGNTVSALRAQFEAEADKIQRSPKLAFSSWLERMEETPGVTFEQGAFFPTLLNQMNDESFLVATERLAPTEDLRHASGLTQSEKDALGQMPLVYDEVTATAMDLQKQHGNDAALKRLSSLVERSPGDAVLLRDVSYSALAWDKPGQAYQLLWRVAQSRPYEPQTYHGLAQAADRAGNNELAVLYYELSVRATWDERFGEFRKIAALDYLHLLQEVSAGKQELGFANFVAQRADELRKDFNFKEADVLVTITWNTDNTDIDLHVIEPDGDECFYRNPNTDQGRMSDDVTQGYGPEMYVSPDAEDGRYRIRANYYGSDPNRIGTRSKIYCSIYTNWGRKNETVRQKVIVLNDAKDMVDLMEIEI